MGCLYHSHILSRSDKLCCEVISTSVYSVFFLFTLYENSTFTKLVIGCLSEASREHASNFALSFTSNVLYNIYFCMFFSLASAYLNIA